jgi:hypothetical protein
MLKFENYLYNTRSERNQVLAEAIIGEKNKRETIGFDQEDIDWLQNNFPYQAYSAAIFKRWQYLKDFLKARDAAREKKIKELKSQENQAWFKKSLEHEAVQRMKKYHPDMRNDLKEAYIKYYVNLNYIMRAAQEVDDKFLKDYVAQHEKDIYDFKGVNDFPEEKFGGRVFRVDSKIPELIRKYEGELGSANGIDLGGVSDESLSGELKNNKVDPNEAGFQTRGGSFGDKRTIDNQVKSWMAASATGMLSHQHAPEDPTGYVEIEDPYAVGWHKKNVKSDIESASKSANKAIQLANKDKTEPQSNHFKELPENDQKTVASNIAGIKSFVTNPKILNYLKMNSTEFDELLKSTPDVLLNDVISKIINLIDNSHDYYSPTVSIKENYLIIEEDNGDDEDDADNEDNEPTVSNSDKLKMIKILEAIRNEKDIVKKTNLLSNILTTSKENKKLTNLMTSAILQNNYNPNEAVTKLWGAKPFTKSESPDFVPLAIKRLEDLKKSDGKKKSDTTIKDLISLVRAPAVKRIINGVEVKAPILFPASYHKRNDEDFEKYIDSRIDPEESREIVGRGVHRRHDEDDFKIHHYDPTKVPGSKYGQGTKSYGPGMINLNYKNIPSYYRDITNPFVRELYQKLSTLGAEKFNEIPRCNLEVKDRIMTTKDWEDLGVSKLFEGKKVPTHVVEGFNLTPDENGEYLCLVAKEILTYLCDAKNTKDVLKDCNMLEKFVDVLKKSPDHEKKAKYFNKMKLAINFHHAYDVALSYIIRMMGKLTNLENLNSTFIKKNVTAALDTIISRDLGWGTKEKKSSVGESIGDSKGNEIENQVHEKSVALDTLFNDLLKNTVGQCQIQRDPSDPTKTVYKCKYRYQDMFSSKVEPFIHDVVDFLRKIEEKTESLNSNISLSNIIQINESIKDAILGIIKLYTLHSFKNLYYSRLVKENNMVPTLEQKRKADQEAEEDTLNYIASIQHEWSSMSDLERSQVGKDFFDKFLHARLRQVENLGSGEVIDNHSPFGASVKMSEREPDAGDTAHYETQVKNSYGQLLDSLSDSAIHSPNLSSLKTHLQRDNEHANKIIDFIDTNNKIIDPDKKRNKVNDILKVTTESFFKSILDLIQSVESENIDAINRAAQDFGDENNHFNNKRLNLRFDQKEINAIINLISKYLESKKNPSKEEIVKQLKEKLELINV